MSIPAFLSPRKSDLQDLKKSSTARCVILGTVTATVNGSELGGMIPPLAHLGPGMGTYGDI